MTDRLDIPSEPWERAVEKAKAMLHEHTSICAGADTCDLRRVARLVLDPALRSLLESGAVVLPEPRVGKLGRPEAPESFRYELTQRLNKGIRWIREAEDYARMEAPGWPTADRIRAIHVQLSEDVLNGRTDQPTMMERVEAAEQRAVRAERALAEKERQVEVVTRRWATCEERAERLEWELGIARRALKDAEAPPGVARLESEAAVRGQEGSE